MNDMRSDSTGLDRDGGRSDLPLLAALAAVSFDYAMAKQAADMSPVQQLATLLRAGGKQEERTKKALTQLTHSTHTEEVKPSNHNASAAQMVDVIQKLTVAAQRGVASLSDDDLKQLRDFCIRLSIAARRPRPLSLLRLG